MRHHINSNNANNNKDNTDNNNHNNNNNNNNNDKAFQLIIGQVPTRCAQTLIFRQTIIDHDGTEKHRRLRACPLNPNFLNPYLINHNGVEEHPRL